MEQTEYYSTIEELRNNWYDQRDNVLPFKLVTGGESKRFAFMQEAIDEFEATESTALLMDHSDNQTRYLAYKFITRQNHD